MKKRYIAREWKLLSNATSKDVFLRDTLKFVSFSLDRSYCDNVVTKLPSLQFHRFILRDNLGFSGSRRSRAYAFSFIIEVDSSRQIYGRTSDFLGRWKFKSKRNKLYLVLKKNQYCREEQEHYSPIKQEQKKKIVYEVLLLNEDKMILVRK